VKLEIVGGNPALAGRAYWEQRQLLAEHGDRLRALATAADDPTSLNRPQWAQLFAVAAALKPGLIIEIGRGFGNSTCAFAEAAAAVGSDTRVLSLCRSRGWSRTAKRIESLVDERWLARLDIRTGDITAFDFTETVQQTQGPVLVFWDAHGLPIANAIISRLLPLLEHREHLILMHDISDARYHEPDRSPYGSNPLWQGELASDHKFRIAHLETSVTQAIAAIDFATRNGMPLHSADESIDQEVTGPGRGPEMAALLGDLWSHRAHWYWFALSEASRQPISFPASAPPRKESLLRRVKRAILVLLGLGD